LSRQGIDTPIIDSKFQGSYVAYTIYLGDSIAEPMGYVYVEGEDLPDAEDLLRPPRPRSLM
jgi:hypothetical protein